ATVPWTGGRGAPAVDERCRDRTDLPPGACRLASRLLAGSHAGDARGQGGDFPPGRRGRAAVVLEPGAAVPDSDERGAAVLHGSSRAIGSALKATAPQEPGITRQCSRRARQ